MTYPWTSGDVLTAADLNDYAGLILVKTQTVGSGVSSVTVTSAFSSTFDNYLIKIDYVDSSTNTTLSLQLDGLTTEYYWNNISMSSASTTVTGGNGANVSSWQIGAFRTTGENSYIVELRNPFLTRRTVMSSDFASSGLWYTGGGVNTNVSSYTGFVLIPTSGTMTGGTIRVYGYNNG